MSLIESNPQSLPCVVMRGGTTRGFFFRPEDLPRDPKVRDDLLLNIVAGHESRQADGLGGVDMLLSKVATVWPSKLPDVDVECSFGAITPGSSRIKYGSNCGNLVSAVALYTLQQGLCPDLQRTVRILNPDSNKRVDAQLMDKEAFHEQVKRMKSMGMALTGTPVDLAFIDPAGTIGLGLLPTGRAVNQLHLDTGVTIDASITDSGTVYVFISASDLGLDFATSPLNSQQQADLLHIVENLRGQAAVLCGLADSPEDARRTSPAVPKVALVSPPKDYSIENGSLSIKARNVDLLARIISSQNLHKAYAVTGAIATISAAVIPGSVVNKLVTERAGQSPFSLRIGHPSGIIEPRLDWHHSSDNVAVDRAYVIRTARRLMTGVSFLPDPLE